MKSRKIQKSGTTFYLYLPAAWCREHNITTDSVVYLEKTSKGDLVIRPRKSESSLTTLELELQEHTPEVINKMIIASYINPVKQFVITLAEEINEDQILEHKKLLGGLELVDFEGDTIKCQTSLALSDPNTLLVGMIRKIISVSKLMLKDKSHELVRRYEEEIDKSNLLINKSIITSLMYRQESNLRHIDLFYIGMISRYLEQITDILISIDDDDPLIEIIHKTMETLLDILDALTVQHVTAFIQSIERLDDIDVVDLKTYKKKRVYALLGHIAETLSDWVVTERVDG